MILLKPLYYKIAVTGYFGVEVQVVSGFAVDTIARICVHEEQGYWECDDYDTGARIGSGLLAVCESREGCIKAAIALLEKHIPTGAYARSQKAALKRLKDAGLL